MASRLLCATVLLAVTLSAVGAPRAESLRTHGRPGPVLRSPLVGVNEDWLLHEDKLGTLKRMGGQLVRQGFRWSSIEPSPGRFDWAPTDHFMSLVRAHHLRVLMVLGDSPCWARPQTPCPLADAAAPPGRHFDGAWELYVRKVVSRYPDAAGVEIWNEPNNSLGPNFFYPRPDVRRYMQLLREAYHAVKASGAGMPVISAGLVQIYNSADGSGRNGFAFLTQMYSLGLRSVSDAIAFHPYSFFSRNPTADVTAQIHHVRAVMRAHGDSAKNLWVTEVGLSSLTGAPTPSSVNSESAQAHGLLSIYRALARIPHLPVVIIHRMLDTGSDAYGLLHADGRPKPAYCLLARTLTHHHRC